MLAVTRFGDMCTGHSPCYPPRQNVQGSEDVFVNGLPVHRVGDAWAPHGRPPLCPPHSSVLAAGSPTVYANGRNIGRIGDPVACGSSVATGSPDTFAG